MFNRYRLLLLSLLLGAGQARAQASVAQAAFPLTRQDTARAVHELFQSRRGGGFGWLAFGAAGMAASIIPAQQSTSAGVWTPGVVIGSTLALLGTKKVVRFGWGREHRVLRELAATGHLPTDIQRRLHGNFAPLHGTASQPDPLLALRPSAPTPVPAAAPAPLPAAPLAPPAATPSVEQVLADARTDTLDAVQGLFLARRSAGTWPLVALLPIARILTGSGAATSSSSPYAPQPAKASDNSVAVGLGLMSAGLAFMLIHNAPYTKAHFEQLRTGYLAGTPLPPALRQKLRPRHLAQGRRYRERMDRRAQRHR
ncbi:hypothetical protein [Hymenobacter antarcticus]|uniref:Uncharacterized protein n=1 Tax=Hymenobacter antarcticus TaxID=486270 RepID=A0ABP7QFQ7_9BACT